MGDSDKKDQWLKRVLGVSLEVRTPPAPPPPSESNKPRPPVELSSVPSGISRPKGQGVQISQTPTGSKPITVAPVPKVSQFKGQDQGKQRHVKVSKAADGRVVYTAPSPPVAEITFSGGGGKGAALPGAVKALHDSGVLKGVKQVAGASVGSMTAALVAAGITGDEFAEIANSQETADRIVEGSGGTKMGLLAAAIKNKVKTGSGSPLTGKGLEGVVCDALNLTLVKRISELQLTCDQNQQPFPQVVSDILPRLEKAPGPTFMDLRVLSQHIPAVKEAVITGTYTAELDDKGKQIKGGNQQGLLYVFSADSEPDLPIAVAVHASASFPMAFKPVDIKLASGMTVRFIDGGVMNNTPTMSSLGNQRDLDGMPQERGMTFVFEDAEDDDQKNVSKNLLKGTVTPRQGKMARLIDWVVGSDHAGSEYAKDRDMTDRPEDIVVVPLKISRPKTSKQGTKDIDMRGGTLEFNLSDKDKLALQNATEQATLSQINRENDRERSHEFESDSQMFVSIPLKDLDLLVSGGYEGAAEARKFRQAVATNIDLLTQALADARSKQLTNALLDRGDVVRALDDLNGMAGDDIDFQGYVGRELNRGALDTLVDLLRKHKKGGGVVKASLTVADTLVVRNGVDHMLKNFIYPQMKMQGSAKGAGMQTIQVMEALLRAAKTKDDVNEALEIGIDHFKTKSDRSKPRRGHKAFAQNLQHLLMH